MAINQWPSTNGHQSNACSTLALNRYLINRYLSGAASWYTPTLDPGGAIAPCATLTTPDRWVVGDRTPPRSGLQGLELSPNDIVELPRRFLPLPGGRLRSDRSKLEGYHGKRN